MKSSLKKAALVLSAAAFGFAIAACKQSQQESAPAQSQQPAMTPGTTTQAAPAEAAPSQPK